MIRRRQVVDDLLALGTLMGYLIAWKDWIRVESKRRASCSAIG